MQWRVRRNKQPQKSECWRCERTECWENNASDNCFRWVGCVACSGGWAGDYRRGGLDVDGLRCAAKAGGARDLV